MLRNGKLSKLAYVSCCLPDFDEAEATRLEDELTGNQVILRPNFKLLVLAFN